MWLKSFQSVGLVQTNNSEWPKNTLGTTDTGVTESKKEL